MRRASLLLIGLGWALLLVGCGKPPALILPTGIQIMTGTLLPADISTLRRGTHVLVANGRRLCFVESTTVNLHAFEQKEVAVRGIFEANTDPALLPVLVADDVRSLAGSASSGSSSSTSSFSPTGSGSLTDTPCGGTAGILCPAGQYCEIADLQENIGHCRKF